MVIVGLPLCCGARALRLTPSEWHGSDARKGLESANVSAECADWGSRRRSVSVRSVLGRCGAGISSKTRPRMAARFRILTLIDEHTRESLAIHAAGSIRALDVILVLEAAIARYGAPEHLRSDNRPEFKRTRRASVMKCLTSRVMALAPCSKAQPIYNIKPVVSVTRRAFLTWF